MFIASSYMLYSPAAASPVPVVPFAAPPQHHPFPVRDHPSPKSLGFSVSDILSYGGHGPAPRTASCVVLSRRSSPPPPPPTPSCASSDTRSPSPAVSASPPPRLKFGMDRILRDDYQGSYAECAPSPQSSSAFTCCPSHVPSECHPFHPNVFHPLYAAYPPHALGYPACTVYPPSAQPHLTSDLDPLLRSHHHHHLHQQSGNGHHHHVLTSASASSSSSGKRKRSWSRAVFSNLQRKGLEKRFQIQKYITKPDRRQLAATLGLTDAQVKVWFQNRRMKWRHSKEAKEELNKQTTTNNNNNNNNNKVEPKTNGSSINGGPKNVDVAKLSENTVASSPPSCKNIESKLAGAPLATTLPLVVVAANTAKSLVN